ncbi:extracellular solute-binding protein [Pseudomonas kielensis]|jgi:putrescine transport system substrate-binding protein|uniref:Extracellular solute-binding protein n=1 Tax=Pseudomonas kielensis TaxID=2762577 RepID=A0A7X1GFR8_9PSED|nr:extracellular solute-binding protein [Pseudomonas kielensis]MBC2691521.1 extracellular solute-binding protein [Pseudomonas kielensis]
MKAISVLMLAVLALPVSAAERIVQFYGWAEYVGASTLKAFEAETGIKVQYDTFDSADVLETKLLTGRSGYDVVVPSIAMLDRLLQAKALQPSHIQQTERFAEMDPVLLSQLATVDKGNLYAVPYTWGTTGMAINRQEIDKRIPDAPISSLDLLFKPEYASKLKDCGVSVIDAPQEVISMALNYLGKSPYSKNRSDLVAAQKLLTLLHPSLRYIGTGTQSSDLANGDLCLALTYSGDAVLARMMAENAKKPFEVDYMIPQEGTLNWIDTLAIPADAPHPEEARAFIEFLTRPESLAELTNNFYYANSNTSATKLIDKPITENGGIYPSDAVRNSLFGEEPMTLSLMRERTRIWSTFRSQR